MPERIRYRFDGESFVEQGIFQGATQIHFSTTFKHRKTSVIYDVVGNPEGFNPCAHHKGVFYHGSRPAFDHSVTGEDHQIFTFTGPWPSSNATTPDTCGIFGYPTFGGEIGSLPSDIGGLVTRRCLDQVLTQIPEKVSIANFLLELKDVKSLIPRIEGLIRTIPNLFLWWEFTANPTVNDIKNLLTVVANVRKRLEHLKRINRRPVTLTYADRNVWTRDEDDYPIFHPSIADYGSHFDMMKDSRSYIRWVQADVVCRVRTYYDLDLNGADAFLNAMCAALGLLNPLKIIWNAIPFSFIVDWLVNLDAFFDNVDIDPFEGTIQILGAHHTIRARTGITTYAPTSSYGTGEWVEIGGGVVHSFIRRDGMPDGTPADGGLTPRQQALLAALGIVNFGPARTSRRPGRRTRRF